MNDLIKVTEGAMDGNLVQTVSARDLHAFLESKADFTTWAKQQIERARLVEGRDYLLHNFVDQLPSGAKHKTDYVFSIESAKHVAMMSGTDKGFEVRDYFLVCEKVAKSQDPLAVLNDPAQMRVILLGYTEQVIALEEKVTEMAPKVAAFDRIATDSDGSVSLRMAAKLLQLPEKRFLQLANTESYIFRHHHSNRWLGYADKIKARLVEQKLTTVERDDGSTKVVEQVLITRAGLAKLATTIQKGGLH